MKIVISKKWRALALCSFAFTGLAQSEEISKTAKAAPSQVEKIDELFSAEDKERIGIFASNLKEQKRLNKNGMVNYLSVLEAERAYYLFSLDLLRLKNASPSKQAQIDLLEKCLLGKLHESWEKFLGVTKKHHEKSMIDLSAYLRVQMDYQLFCVEELSKNKK